MAIEMCKANRPVPLTSLPPAPCPLPQVLGPNGAGKSTLLKAISGALPLWAGSRTLGDGVRLAVFSQDLAQVGGATQRGGMKLGCCWHACDTTRPCPGKHRVGHAKQWLPYYAQETSCKISYTVPWRLRAGSVP